MEDNEFLGARAHVEPPPMEEREAREGRVDERAEDASDIVGEIGRLLRWLGCAFARRRLLELRLVRVGVAFEVVEDKLVVR